MKFSGRYKNQIFVFFLSQWRKMREIERSRRENEYIYINENKEIMKTSK